LQSWQICTSAAELLWHGAISCIEANPNNSSTSRQMVGSARRRTWRTDPLQIVNFQISCGFPGLRSVLLRTSDHRFEPITDIQVSEVLPGDRPDAVARIPAVVTAVHWAGEGPPLK
jgi:hypothetical protein